MPNREERQDVNKLRKAGSDLPPRGEGVKEIDTSKSGKSGGKSNDAPPKGYRGEHRRK